MVIDKKDELGSRVRQLRMERGYTREQLAEFAEISVGFLSDIERSRKGVGADILGRLATALRVSVDYLLYGKEIDDYSVGRLIVSFTQGEQEQLKRVLNQCIKILDGLKTSRNKQK